MKEIDPDGSCVCRFVIPALNLLATDYLNLIDWQTCYMSSASVLRDISSQELLENDTCGDANGLLGLYKNFLHSYTSSWLN